MRSPSLAVVLLATACGGGTGGSDAPVRVDLMGFSGLEYAAPITLGGQQFLALADTGSTTTAVAGSTCFDCGVTPQYTPGSTATDTHQTATTTYGDNSMWTGEVFTDKGAIGDAPSVTLEFVSMTQQTDFFKTAAFEAILGLGPSDLLAPHTSSLAVAEFAAGLDAELAFELCHDHGALFVGGFDATLASSPPVFTAMLPLGSTEPFYAIHLGSMAIGTTSITTGLGTPIVDTGTSLSYLPTAAFTSLLAAITQASGYDQLFSGQQLSDGGCVDNGSVTDDMVDAMMPPLLLGVGGSSQPISLPATRSYFTDQGGGMFCLAISDAGALGQGSDFGVLGDSVLAGALTVFDIANNRIGFAPDIGCGSAVGSAVAPFVVDRAPGTPWWRNHPGFHPPPVVTPSKS